MNKIDTRITDDLLFFWFKEQYPNRKDICCCCVATLFLKHPAWTFRHRYRYRRLSVNNSSTLRKIVWCREKIKFASYIFIWLLNILFVNLLTNTTNKFVLENCCSVRGPKSCCCTPFSIVTLLFICLNGLFLCHLLHSIAEDEMTLLSIPIHRTVE